MVRGLESLHRGRVKSNQTNVVKALMRRLASADCGERTRSVMEEDGSENLTRSKSLEAGDRCPRCQGLLVLRDVVEYDVAVREIWCCLCSRTWRHETREPYRPMPREEG